MTKPYELAADDLVAVLYHSKEAYHAIRFQHGMLSKWFPVIDLGEGVQDTRYQKFVETIYWLHDNDKPIHDTSIIDRAPGITPQWLAERVTLYDGSRDNAPVIATNCEIVRREGIHNGRMRLLDIARKQMAEKGATSSNDITSRLMSLLSTVGQEQAAENVKASEHAKANRLRDANTMDGAIAGINFIDTNSNGYEHGQIWWIGGAYKQRKTTLLLNMLLAICMKQAQTGDMGISPAFLSFEMVQGRVQRQLEAMLAIAWLSKQGILDGHSKNGNGKNLPNNWIDQSIIKRLNRAYGNLSGEQQLNAYRQWVGVRGDAIFWAQRMYEQFSLRIYDRTPKHGNLNTLASVETAVNMDIVRYGGNWFGVDYLQLVEVPGANMFEQTRAVSIGLQALAIRKHITMIMLAQLNEDTIRNGSSYSPGVKGGGDAAATADYFIRTRYKDGKDAGGITLNTDTDLHLEMKLSRHDGNGHEIVNIHPASGLILGQSWLQEMTV